MTKVAFAVLPWAMSNPSFTVDEQTLRHALQTIAAAGFDGVPIDVPAGMNAAHYGSLLAENGMVPAPGYLMVSMAATDQEIRAAAMAHSDVHHLLGQSRTFLAADMAAERMEQPAAGAGFDAARQDRMIEGLTIAARALTETGITPALHQHVGGWLETEAELDSVLARIPAEVLSFGPDTGHLSWAGMDAPGVIRRYADRVSGIHLKDMHADIARKVADAGTAYFPATMEDHLWAEPGRGDVDLDAVLNLVSAANGYDDWYIIEVDVPDLVDIESSVAYCGEWAQRTLRASP